MMTAKSARRAKSERRGERKNNAPLTVIAARKRSARRTKLAFEKTPVATAETMSAAPMSDNRMVMCQLVTPLSFACDGSIVKMFPYPVCARLTPMAYFSTMLFVRIFHAGSACSDGRSATTTLPFVRSVLVAMCATSGSVVSMVLSAGLSSAATGFTIEIVDGVSGLVPGSPLGGVTSFSSFSLISSYDVRSHKLFDFVECVHLPGVTSPFFVIMPFVSLSIALPFAFKLLIRFLRRE